MRGLILGLIFWLASSVRAATDVALPDDGRAEVQRHGLIFEKWVRDTFFGGYEPKGYTQKWDVPADANNAHGGIPANPKAAKFGTSVDLGDALRQFDIAQSGQRFWLIVGFWEQDGDAKKWVNAAAAEVMPEKYRELWGNVTRAELEKLDAVVKDKSLDLDEARKQAQAIKRRLPFSASIIQVNPKIDANQRRLQCSLRFADFFKHLAPTADAGRQDAPRVFGVALPAEFTSPPRKIKPAGAR